MNFKNVASPVKPSSIPPEKQTASLDVFNCQETRPFLTQSLGHPPTPKEIQLFSDIYANRPLENFECSPMLKALLPENAQILYVQVRGGKYDLKEPRVFFIQFKQGDQTITLPLMYHACDKQEDHSLLKHSKTALKALESLQAQGVIKDKVLRQELHIVNVLPPAAPETLFKAVARSANRLEDLLGQLQTVVVEPESLRLLLDTFSKQNATITLNPETNSLRYNGESFTLSAGSVKQLLQVLDENFSTSHYIKAIVSQSISENRGAYLAFVTGDASLPSLSALVVATLVREFSEEPRLQPKTLELILQNSSLLGLVTSPTPILGLRQKQEFLMAISRNFELLEKALSKDSVLQKFANNLSPKNLKPFFNTILETSKGTPLEKKLRALLADKQWIAFQDIRDTILNPTPPSAPTASALHSTVGQTRPVVPTFLSQFFSLDEQKSESHTLKKQRYGQIESYLDHFTHGQAPMPEDYDSISRCLQFLAMNSKQTDSIGQFLSKLPPNIACDIITIPAAKDYPLNLFQTCCAFKCENLITSLLDMLQAERRLESAFQTTPNLQHPLMLYLEGTEHKHLEILSRLFDLLSFTNIPDAAQSKLLALCAHLSGKKTSDLFSRASQLANLDAPVPLGKYSISLREIFGIQSQRTGMDLANLDSLKLSRKHMMAFSPQFPDHLRYAGITHLGFNVTDELGLVQKLSAMADVTDSLMTYMFLALKPQDWGKLGPLFLDLTPPEIFAMNRIKVNPEVSDRVEQFSFASMALRTTEGRDLLSALAHISPEIQEKLDKLYCLSSLVVTREIIGDSVPLRLEEAQFLVAQGHKAPIAYLSQHLDRLSFLIGSGDQGNAGLVPTQQSCYAALFWLLSDPESRVEAPKSVSELKELKQVTTDFLALFQWGDPEGGKTMNKMAKTIAPSRNQDEQLLNWILTSLDTLYSSGSSSKPLADPVGDALHTAGSLVLATLGLMGFFMMHGLYQSSMGAGEPARL